MPTLVNRSTTIKGKKYNNYNLVKYYRDSEEKKSKKKILYKLGNISDEEANDISKILKSEDFIDINNLIQNKSLLFGHINLIVEKAKQLKLDHILGDQFLNTMIMVSCRLINPMSKLANIRRYETTYLYKENENINYKNLYSTLDYLEENQKDIENKLFKNRKTKPSLILYDITSTYVWGEKCELAEYGYSRDNMPGNKQIVIGLVTDNEGNPICIEILKGNTADTSTMVDTIKGLKERFEIESVIMVVDRGMNIEYNLDKAIQEGVEIDLEKFKYITACKKNEIEKKIKSKFDIGLFDKKEYTEIEDKEKRKRYVVMYSKLRIESDKKQRETAIEKTKKAFKRIENSIKLKKTQKENEVWIKIGKWKDKWYVGNCFEYEVKEENGEIKFEYKENEKEIKRMQEYDGLYVLETNIMDEKIKKEDIVRIYKEKDVVEKAFEFIKTDLEIQPLYHYLEKRVKGHIFVCYIAYMIGRRLKEDRKEELKADSFESLITELGKINYIDQYIKQGKQQKDISKIVGRTELAKQLYKKSGIKIGKISSP